MDSVSVILFLLVLAADWLKLLAVLRFFFEPQKHFIYDVQTSPRTYGQAFHRLYAQPQQPNYKRRGSE